MRRKGVTPVVATVLLISIGIAAVGSAGIFLQDVADQIMGSAEDEISQDNMIEESEISIEYGFENGDGDISVDVRNTGSTTLQIVEDGQRRWNLYIDGQPQTSWEFADSSLNSDANVDIKPQEQVRIDTNSDYPSSGNAKRVQVSGTYETQSSIICNYSDNGSC